MLSHMGSHLVTFLLILNFNKIINTMDEVKEVVSWIIGKAEEVLFPEGGPRTKNEQLPDLTTLELNTVEYAEGTLKPLG